MKKKFIALFCVVALAVTALGITAAAAEDGAMLVGYAKMDINPYVYHYEDENR